MQYVVGSSCQDTVARCEAAEECRWHLGELRVRCAPNTCRRTDCAAALQRFARFVPFALVESMMFCHCSAGDSLCAQQQEMLYPKCLYSTSSAAITCTEAARKCDTDHRCRHLRHSLSANCPVAYDACAKTSLDECRRTILHARASILEQPCYCPLSDVECMAHQRTMIPNNPCIEKAMLDYSRLMGYNTPTAAKTASIETNRVHEVTAAGYSSSTGNYREKAETHRPDSSRTTDGRGTTRSRGEEYRQTERPDQWSRKDSDGGYRDRYRGEQWEEKEAGEGGWGNVSVANDELVLEQVVILTNESESQGDYRRGSATRQQESWSTGGSARYGGRYVDWSGRCSSWCECVAEDELVCERLPCLEDGRCEAPLTTVDFGERLFLRDRGACFCESGTFICDLPEEMPEVYPGIYLSAGYSTVDVEMLRSEVPHDVLERAGFLSSNAATDIASRLQIAFERILPKGRRGAGADTTRPATQTIANIEAFQGFFYILQPA
ncbi:unnamed protein product [Heligmosomoides polygyrus]|uniref:GDNF domain-containing protein n=1 Tax=Heligmosomoides polygyrus TaxID=6339 RepID=A0A3P7Z1E9_HELPZ|nr:unnamed protein product [Heligmosomoides polygyrus]